MSLGNLKKITFLLIVFGLSSCGRAYFPIELKNISRSERAEKQDDLKVNLVAMTQKSIREANSQPYIRRVVKADKLENPAKFIDADKALIEKTPIENNPGIYRIGVGDEISFSQVVDNNGIQNYITRSVVVKETGSANILSFGNLKVEGLSQSELEDLVNQKILESGDYRNIEDVIISKFNSKKIYIITDYKPPVMLPYVATPMYLKDVISTFGSNVSNVVTDPTADSKIIILRAGVEYTFSLNKLLKSEVSKYRLYPNDTVLIKPLNYKEENILLVGETGAQRSIKINSFLRPTLSDAIFSGFALNNVTSDFSQIYVIRKKSKKLTAYHLDITNPGRISLASKFEMRPDDIVFVATQPLSLYSRTLSQILGSTGLTLQARDTIRNEIGN